MRKMQKIKTMGIRTTETWRMNNLNKAPESLVSTRGDRSLDHGLVPTTPPPLEKEIPSIPLSRSGRRAIKAPWLF
jgi:hypothetical protein